MTKRIHRTSFLQMLLIALITVTPAFGQPTWRSRHDRRGRHSR